jgi:hemolysin activation/secretion protein
MFSARYMMPIRITTGLSDAFTLGADYKDFAQNVVVDPTMQLQTPISYVNWVVSYGGASRLERELWTWSAGANFGIKGLGNSIGEFADKCFGCRPDYLIWRADGSLEQFLLGGVQSVRGYLEAEELGDLGIRGTVELRGPRWHAKTLNFTSYVFVDSGHTRLQQPLPGEPSEETLTSFGAGFDFEIFKFLSGTFVWALPLADGTYTERDSSRWLFAVRSSW